MNRSSSLWIEIEAEGDWKRSLTFLLLFIFLYAALGASLTLDLSSLPVTFGFDVFLLDG
jgi:hypothetical protein